MSRRAVLAVACICLLSGLMETVFADVWRVNEDGTGDFATVVIACETVSDGDTVYVSPGYYDEWDTLLRLDGKGVVLIGDGNAPDDTILRICFRFENCWGSTFENLSIQDAWYPLLCEGGSTLMKNCTVRNNTGAGGDEPPIVAQSTNFVIDNCIFANNSNEGTGGALAGGSLSIRQSLFVDNVASVMGGALFLGGNSTVENCVFYRNVAGTGAAIALINDPVVRQCTFLRNEVTDPNGGTIVIAGDFYEWIRECVIVGTVNGYGVDCSVGVGSLSCCDVWDNERGPYIGWCELGENLGNFAEDPLFCDPETGDVGLLEGSPCLPEPHGGYDCGLIGAYGEGCGQIPVQEVTWGEIKTTFR